MDLKAICDHLRLARLALGPEHPLSSRIEMVERHLTPGDPLFRNDAVSAETDLLAIAADLQRAQVEVTPGVSEAIKQIGEAIELL
jgi:hypothetical protein